MNWYDTFHLLVMPLAIKCHFMPLFYSILRKIIIVEVVFYDKLCSLLFIIAQHRQKQLQEVKCHKEMEL